MFLRACMAVRLRGYWCAKPVRNGSGGALMLAVGVDLLFSLGGQEAGGVELAGEVELVGANFVALGAVHARGHALEVGDSDRVRGCE